MNLAIVFNFSRLYVSLDLCGITQSFPYSVKVLFDFLIELRKVVPFAIVPTNAGGHALNAEHKVVAEVSHLVAIVFVPRNRLHLRAVGVVLKPGRDLVHAFVELRVQGDRQGRRCMWICAQHTQAHGDDHEQDLVRDEGEGHSRHLAHLRLHVVDTSRLPVLL